MKAIISPAKIVPTLIEPLSSEFVTQTFVGFTPSQAYQFSSLFEEGELNLFSTRTVNCIESYAAIGESAIGCSESNIPKSPLVEASEKGVNIIADIELNNSKSTKL